MQSIVSDTSEVSRLLSRLEERYDRENRPALTGEAPVPPLSPQIEEFLQGLDFDTGDGLATDPDDDPDDE